MNSRILVLASAAILAAAGCSIPYTEAELQTLNACSADSDCAEGS